MSIGYYKLNRKLRVKGEVKDVYVARVAYASEINTDLLAEEVAASTNASPAEVLMWLRALEYQISRHIAEGDVVKLDSLGSFYPTMHAVSQDTPEKVTSRTITSLGVLFRPTVRFSRKVKKAGVHLADRRIFDADRRKPKNEPDNAAAEAEEGRNIDNTMSNN